MAKKRRITPRFYVVLFLFIASVLSIGYVLFKPPQQVTIKQGTIEFREYFDGVVLRDEKTIKVDEYGKAEYYVAEGAEVVRGELVASAYTLSYNQKIISELTDIRQQIKDYQENVLLKDIVNVELSTINQNIEEKSLEIRASVLGETKTDLLALERELSKLMEDKEAYLMTAVKPDEQLNTLYERKENVLQSITGAKIDLFSESSGVISFYFDGLEAFFSIDNIDSYDVNEMNNVISGTDIDLYKATDIEYPLYKVVNNARWYIVVVSDKNIPEFNKNTYFTMIFDQNTEKQHIGELLGKRIYGNGYVYTFEFTEDIDQMLAARVVSVEMYNIFEGMMVPTQAIKHEDGVEFVTVVLDGKEAKIPVIVAANKGGETIVKEVEGFNPLQAGDQIIY